MCACEFGFYSGRLQSRVYAALGGPSALLLGMCPPRGGANAARPNLVPSHLTANP